MQKQNFKIYWPKRKNKWHQNMLMNNSSYQRLTYFRAKIINKFIWIWAYLKRRRSILWLRRFKTKRNQKNLPKIKSKRKILYKSKKLNLIRNTRNLKSIWMSTFHMSQSPTLSMSTLLNSGDHFLQRSFWMFTQGMRRRFTTKRGVKMIWNNLFVPVHFTIQMIRVRWTESTLLVRYLIWI